MSKTNKVKHRAKRKGNGFLRQILLILAQVAFTIYIYIFISKLK